MARPRDRIQRRPRRPSSSPTRTVNAGKDDSPFQKTTVLNLKRRGINRSVSVVSGMFFLCVFIYMTRAAMGFFSTTIPTALVDIGSREEPQAIQGIIIRNETVHSATRSGQVMFEVNEDDRVTRGILVASVGEIDAAREIIANLNRNEEEIRNLAGRRGEISPVTTEAIGRINDYITSLVVSRAHSFTTIDIADIYSVRDRLMDAIDNRNSQLFNDNVHVSGDLHRINQQIRELLGSELHDMHATDTGIVSFITDGYEAIFTPNNMLSINEFDMNINIDTASLIPNREVEEGEPVFRVVGNIWYIAAFLPSEMTEDFRVGDNIMLFISNDDLGHYVPMLFRIDSIDREQPQPLVIFLSTRNIHEFVNQRVVYIQMTDTVQRGLRIPNSAIVTKRFFTIPLGYIHGETSHYVVVHTIEDGNINVPVELFDIPSNTVAYIIEETAGIELGIRLMPTDSEVLGSLLLQMNHIYTMYGVFRVNDGFADFRVINVPETSDPELNPNDFTVLDPTTNSTLRRFDRIVLDPTSVHQDMRIR